MRCVHGGPVVPGVRRGTDRPRPGGEARQDRGPGVTRLLAAVCALLLAALTSCTAASDGKTRESSHGRVDVDTAALRHARSQAGVEPCRPGTSRSRLPETTLPCLGGGKDVDLHRLK